MKAIQGNKEISREAKVFANKTARSIAEIQQSINNMADVLVFLEVLGYDDRNAKENGFESLNELAKYVYNFIDAYDDKSGESDSFTVEVPSTKKRLAESLSMIFPWLGSLVLLFMTGVSLWMAWGLPAGVTTAFLAGVFLGLVLTEGLLQNYNRLFSFYYSQTNIGEVKRSMKRSYALAGVILSGTVAALYGASVLANIPLELTTITAISTVTISLHRVSYVIMYTLKKLAHLTLSYTIAFAVLAGAFFLAPNAIPDVTVRYFAALGSAFAVLCGFAIYHHYKIIGQSSTYIVAKNAPHFYSPLTVSDNTITSRFGVKVSESKKIDWFLQYSYRKLMAASIGVSVAGAVILNLAAPMVVGYLGGSEVSLRILAFASAGAVFISIFAANGVFMIFLGKAKALAQVSLVAAFIVCVAGVFLAQYGFENTVIAYLAATVFAGMASTIVMRIAIRKAGSLLFARYI